jgi:hypothetical protein
LLLHTANGAAASGHRSSGVLQPQLPPDKLSRLPNVPLLDVCTGQWRGLWDLFPVKARGCSLGTLSLSASLLRRFYSLFLIHLLFVLAIVLSFFARILL